MPKQVIPELHEWARILYSVNPDGRVPEAAPGRSVVTHVEREMSQTRLFEPLRYGPGDLLPPRAFSTIQGWAQALRDSAVDCFGRSIINLPHPAKDELRSWGLIDRLESTSSQDLAEPIEAMFMYYQDAGSLPLHVDDQAEYQFNLLMTVFRHRPPEGSGTGTLFWLEDGPHRHDLDPECAIFFDAHSTPHGRLPLDPGDEVVLLSLGFMRA